MEIIGMEPGQRPSPPSSEPSVKYNAKDETVVIGEFDRRKVYKTKPKKTYSRSLVNISLRP